MMKLLIQTYYTKIMNPKILKQFSARITSETSQTSATQSENSGRSKKRRNASEWKEVAIERLKQIRRLESKVNTLQAQLLLSKTVNQRKNEYLMDINMLDAYWQWASEQDAYEEDPSRGL